MKREVAAKSFSQAAAGMQKPSMPSARRASCRVGTSRSMNSGVNTEAAHRGSVKLAGVGASRSPRRLISPISRTARLRS